MSRSSRYSPEFRERAVRMVLEQQGEHSSQWAAMGGRINHENQSWTPITNK